MLACLAALWIGDREHAILAIPTALYGLLLLGLTVWLIPEQAQQPAAGAVSLRATGSRPSIAARDGVAALSFAWVMVIGVALGGLYGGIHVPFLSAWMASVRATHTIFPDGAQPWHSLATEVLIPGALMLACGATLRQLGVARTVRGTGGALLACLALPILMSAFTLFTGRISPAALGLATLRSSINAGFSEEFLARGIWLSQLRAHVTDHWALVISATMFALPHLGGTIAEERGNILLAVANVIALNAPIGVALGMLALRSRSLLLPGAVHTSLDVMARLTGAH